MIIKEIVEINGVQYVYHYSDRGVYIERDGLIYSEALDPIMSQREYIETDKKLEIEGGHNLLSSFR